LDRKSVAADLRGELVARERESNALAEFRRAAAAGRGCVVLVGGEAGVGKSRLLRQFVSSAESGRAGVAFARCVEFVQTPLGPIRELLADIERGNQAPRETGVRALIERLAFARSADAESAQPADWLFESIDAALSRCAARGTLVLAIEDVHWADRSTLGLLAYLADRIGSRRLMIVATYRTHEVGSDHPRLADFAALLAKGAVTNLELGPLDERSTHALVEAALPHPEALEPGTFADIVRRSQGNPFFAEELVKSALERGLGDRRRQLPLSIRAAVLARAALLSDDERKVLSLGAVLGQRFSVERLVTLSNGRRDEVLLALERARALQLLDDRLDAPGDVMFRHALTQEVLYGELLAERVRPLHEAIGRELEARPDRTAVSVELAHHWWRAGDAERASTYAELAGDAAFAIGAMADAVSYYERARAMPKRDGALAAGLEHKIGLSLGSLGRLDAAIKRLRTAGNLYWEAGAFEEFAKNAAALGAQLYNSGDTEGTIDLCRSTIAALEAKLPAASLDRLRARMSYDFVAALDVDSALALVSEIGEPISDPAIAVTVYQVRFKIAAMRGDVEDWRADGRRALEAAGRVVDDGYRLYQTHCQVALDAIGLGEIERAREQLRAALGSEPTRYGALAPSASSFEHTLRADFATAVTLLGRASAVSGQNYASLVHLKIAQVALGVCAGDDARWKRDDVERLLRHGSENGMKLAVGLLGGPYAWALGNRGDVDDAADWIRRLAKLVPGAHRFLFLFLAAAQFGRRSDVLALRGLLVAAAARPQDRVNKAVLGLYDAFAAHRDFLSVDPRTSALDAAAAFQAIGWAWLAGRSYELAGDAKRALETFRACGAVRDVRRLEAGRSDATTIVLSPREREVGELVAAGHSNDEVAKLLHISPRTVEKHVSSALEKLGLRSRVQLGRILGGSA
jgi:DNA-binding CsgD family transcriptional regulator